MQLQRDRGLEDAAQGDTGSDKGEGRLGQGNATTQQHQQTMHSWLSV